MRRLARRLESTVHGPLVFACEAGPCGFGIYVRREPRAASRASVWTAQLGGGCGRTHRSSGLSPVCLAMRASIRGPISSRS